MRLVKSGAAVLALLTVMGCSGMKISDFENQEPKLELESFFAGKTEASGIFYDRFGDVRRQFVVDIEGKVEGDRLILVEDFVYDDGETERRVWTLTCVGDNRYEGTADGVIGIARGQIAGNAFHWEYTFDLKMKDRTLRVAFDDWMFLQPNGTVINRATVSKWGIELGTAVISFSKPQALAGMAANANEERIIEAAE